MIWIFIINYCRFLRNTVVITRMNFINYYDPDK